MCAYFFKPESEYQPFMPVLTHEQTQIRDMITHPHFETFKQSLQGTYTFNAGNPQHLPIIVHLTDAAQKKLHEVKAIDKEISATFALGLLSSISSIIPFNWLLAPAAWMYTGYLAKERDTVYAEYTESLRQLHACCHWAANNGQATTDEIIALPQVQSMLAFLSEVMTTTQMADILADQHEATFFGSLRVPDAAKVETLHYKIYGYDQGGSITGILTKIAGYAKQTLTKAVTDALVYLNTPEDSTPRMSAM